MIILYAEDDIDDFQIFSDTLKSVDSFCIVFNVFNGQEVLDFLETSTILPDLVLLDINMPVMDGRACLKRIRQDERYKDLPVIMLTTSQHPQDKALCMELGAKDFLQKPTSTVAAEEQAKKIIALLKR